MVSDQTYDENLERSQESRLEFNHVSDSLALLLYFGLLILTLLTIWVFKRQRLRFLHETGVAVIYGIIVGIVIRFGVHDSKPSLQQFNISNENSTVYQLPPERLILNLSSNEKSRIYEYNYKRRLYGKDIDAPITDEKATFNPEIFFNIILPPIIFCAGYNMKRRHFFNNLGTIITLAFIGTTISCAVIGTIMYWCTRVTARLSATFQLYECLLFGAIVSATDPVTVLAIFSDLNADADLYALVFGESVLNDAVAIVLVQSIERYGTAAAASGANGAAMMTAALSFISVFLIAILIGCGMGCATALITKYTHVHEQPLLESSLLILMSYCTFLAAEAAHSTGIVAVLFCGVCQAHYTFNNLSPESQLSTKSFFEQLNFLAENFTFVYIGVSVFTYTSHEWDPLFVLAGIVSVIVGRALNIYPLCNLLNLGRNKRIPLSHMHMLMFSGLRGAIAFALAIRNASTDARKIIFTTILVIVVTTVLLCGGCTTYMLQWLRISVGNEEQQERSGAYAQESSDTASNQQQGVAKWWSSFDSRIVKPLLTHARPLLSDSCPGCCLPLTQLLTTPQQMQQGSSSGGGRSGFGHQQEDVEAIIEEEFTPHSAAAPPAVAVSAAAANAAADVGEETEA